MGEVMQSTHIPLDKAWVCVNCDTVSDSQKVCPACASTQDQLNLAAMLDPREWAWLSKKRKERA